MVWCMSGLDFFKAETSRQHIVTFSSQLDNLLGGGVQLQSITDFCGAVGSGKTDLCHQLCIDVQLPECVGGVAGEAVYIDTNCGFSIPKLQDLAEACAAHCEWIQETQGVKVTLPEFSKLLAGVHILSSSTGSLTDLVQVVRQLGSYVALRPKVRLVVIDSFSKPFLLFYDHLQKRTALVYEMFAILQKVAWDYNLTVVLTSQLTTNIFRNGNSEIVPGMGQGIAHRSPHCVILGTIHMSDDITRRAVQVLKSPSRPKSSAYFDISMAGIRDEGVTALARLPSSTKTYPEKFRHEKIEEKILPDSPGTYLGTTR